MTKAPRAERQELLTKAPRAERQELSRVVTEWYEANGRELPWRGSDPWSVLVSEVMLQQTPVSRVLPVFLHWRERWPTPVALASAPPGEALTAWGRLGYPKRALYLRSAAHRIVTDHGGEVPDDLTALRSLPGVGDYTARAVAAFGFGRRHGVVDVNVRRVLARFVSGVSDSAPSPTDVRTAESLLPDDAAHAARMSAGLMELGALLCRTSSPPCQLCPLASRCRWLRLGRPPVGARRARQPPYQGSDRQARGDLLSVLTDGRALDAVAARRAVPESARRRRALAGLAADGLIVRDGSLWRFPAPSEIAPRRL